jgi:hypothetical protein
VAGLIGGCRLTRSCTATTAHDRSPTYTSMVLTAGPGTAAARPGPVLHPLSSGSQHRHPSELSASRGQGSWRPSRLWSDPNPIPAFGLAKEQKERARMALERVLTRRWISLRLLDAGAILLGDQHISRILSPLRCAGCALRPAIVLPRVSKRLTMGRSAKGE